MGLRLFLRWKEISPSKIIAYEEMGVHYSRMAGEWRTWRGYLEGHETWQKAGRMDQKRRSSYAEQQNTRW